MSRPAPVPLSLLRASADVEYLGDERAVHPGDPRRERRYLVYRAALADRAAPLLAETDQGRSGQDAEDTARRLLEHDRAHGTGSGPVPAADARWDSDARGYARQEHAAAVRDEHDQEHVRT
ncbi:hypothetical protein [Streptomyces achromogenes]|uniref:hypothetical protein n=1 Tax=Streptomyces achromogenes TaxID=67255 RepID=UPI00343580D9